MSAQYKKKSLFQTVLDDIKRDRAAADAAAAARAATSTVKTEDKIKATGNGNASINHFLQLPKLEKLHSKPKVLESNAKSMDEALQKFFNSTMAGKFNYRPLETLKNIDRTEFERICKAARENDPVARFDLGRCYAFKIHFTEQNDRLGALWFAKANELGYIPAKYNLALSYLKRFEGLDHPGNIPRAFQLLYEAATAPDPYIPAQNNLAVCYFQNIGIQPCAENLLLAFFWFKKSFLSGNPVSKKRLEKCKSICREIYSDLDLDKFEITTPEVFLIQIRSKIEETNLGYKIKKLASFANFNEFESMKKRALSLDPKYLSDKFYLGLCYETALNVPQDIRTAILYHSESAKLGFAAAQVHLAAFYKKNALKYEPGTPKNLLYFKHAFIWYSAAAKQGHTEAQYNLACCYIDNQGIDPADPQNARHVFTWLMRAALGGNLNAQQRLLECFKNNYGVPQELHTPSALKFESTQPTINHEAMPIEKPEQAKKKSQAEPASAAATETTPALTVATPESQEPINFKQVPQSESAREITLKATIALKKRKQLVNDEIPAKAAAAAADTPKEMNKEFIVISDDSGEADDTNKYKPSIEEPKHKRKRK